MFPLPVCEPKPTEVKEKWPLWLPEKVVNNGNETIKYILNEREALIYITKLTHHNKTLIRL